MKIIALAENTSVRDDLETVHGLGIYVETPKHKLLFDVGPKGVIFKNAERLGINLAEIDTVIISHGHYDHGGALAEFLKINEQAKVYIRRQAFEPHFAKVADNEKFIGLDAGLAKDERIVFTGGATRIDEELFVFSGVDAALDTQVSRALLKKTPNGYEQDDFGHEQNLILTAEGKAALFSGCSHSGVDRILAAALGYRPDISAVFGGFHLFNPDSGKAEPAELVRELAKRLAAREAVFFTCHCTGQQAFDIMRETMGEKLQYLSTGALIEP